MTDNIPMELSHRLEYLPALVGVYAYIFGLFDAGTTQTLVNDLRAKLISLGIIQATW